MSKDLLKAIPFAVGLIGIALFVGLPSGCGDQINQTDAPPHSSDIPRAELPPKTEKAGGPAKQASATTPHTKPAPPTVKPLLKGWEKPITGAKSFYDLPKEARAYVEFIENFVGIKVQYIGTGPGRESMITR